MPVRVSVTCAALGSFRAVLRASSAVKESSKRKTTKRHARVARQASTKTTKGVLSVSHATWANLAPGQWLQSFTARHAPRGSSRTAQVTHRVCPVSAAPLGRGAMGVRAAEVTAFAPTVQLDSSTTSSARVCVCSVPLAGFRMSHGRLRALSAAVVRSARGKGVGVQVRVFVPCVHPASSSTRR